MSLSRVRLVYAGSVIAVAVLLALTGSPIHIGAAVVLLVIAAPMLRAIEHVGWQEGIDKSEYTVDAILTNLEHSDDHQCRPAPDRE